MLFKYMYLEYCKLYKELLKNCIELNREVFGEDYKHFCVKYQNAINKYCN